MPANSRAAASASGSLATELKDALDWLETHASKQTRDGLVRYGIVAPSALGVTVGDVRALGKRIGPQHALAQALWRTGVYEARLLSAFVADAAELSPEQMDAWCREFDNWALCDTLCFHLFDRSPHAFSRVEAWATDQDEFVKRAAFALLASLALHDRRADDAPFAACLPLIAAGAGDARNFVKKAVSWALRAVGARSRALHVACLELAGRLATQGPTQRWVGKDVLRDLTRPKVKAALAAREARRRAPTSRAVKASAKADAAQPAVAASSPAKKRGTKAKRMAGAKKTKKKAKKTGNKTARRARRAG